MKGILMKVSDIVRIKGSEVATLDPSDTVAEAVRKLAELSFGALVVSADGSSLDGILSERDIVRSLNHDPDTLAASVSALMTTEVVTCSMSDNISDLMVLMTGRRIRHLPVVAGGELAGLVSIGDVVKARLAELEDERRHLEDYITTGR